MWDLAGIPEIAAGLDPVSHSFTYTYPPPYVSRARSVPGGIGDDVSDRWPDFSAYVHIPFCRMNCNFCSLHREVIRHDSPVDAYLEAVLREWRLVAPKLAGVPLTALYIGGGTPSILSSDQLKRILDEIASGVPATQPEVTVECAPDPARDEAAWADFFGPLVQRGQLPVTRVSVGIQAWDDTLLSRMGRTDTRKSALTLLRAVERQVPVYNTDFVIGYPSGLGIEWEVREVIRAIMELRACGLSLPNISVYQLWDVDTLFLTNRRRALLPTTEAVRDALWFIQNSLYRMGYQAGNGATFITAQGHVPRWFAHRSTQFRQLGFGSGSYSLLPCGFVQRDRDIARYIDVMSSLDATTVDRRLNHHHRLTEADAEIRRVIMGLRSGETVAWPSSSAPQARVLSDKLDRLVRHGLLDASIRHVRLARSAFILANSIAAFLHPEDVPRKPRL
jgi:coproporphyrinogen III oxidase-like Fe-S oxidoreductase